MPSDTEISSQKGENRQAVIASSSGSFRFTPAGHGLVIGNNVTIGHRVILHGCTVEDFALVGMGSIVLDGAVIKSRAMLAAGSLV